MQKVMNGITEAIYDISLALDKDYLVDFLPVKDRLSPDDRVVSGDGITLFLLAGQNIVLACPLASSLLPMRLIDALEARGFELVVSDLPLSLAESRTDWDSLFAVRRGAKAVA